MLGSLAVWRLPDPPSHPPVEHPSFWRSIGEGVSVAAKSDQIWPVLLLNFGVGIFYVGPFMAVLPLVVRDNYQGGALELSYVNLAFWAATIMASMALVALARRLTLRGRLIGVAVAFGALILVALSTLPPFPVFVALNFVWGLGAGITMTQSRTVVQIVAPPTHRARLMSLFQLGLGGGGPIRRIPDRHNLLAVGPQAGAAASLGDGAADRRGAGPLAPVDDANGRVATRRRRAGQVRGSARRPGARKPDGSCPRRRAAASA